MQRIKFTSKTTAKTSEGLKYKGYAVGELPPTFALYIMRTKKTMELKSGLTIKD